MNPNTENPITAAPTSAAILPTNRHAEWESAGYVHLIEPMRPETEARLVELGAVRSGYRDANEAPEGSVCSDGDPDVGLYVPAAWTIGEDHADAKRWNLAAREQGKRVEGWLTLAIPRPDGGSVVASRVCGRDVCDWPELVLVELDAVAGPAPPAVAA